MVASELVPGEGADVEAAVMATVDTYHHPTSTAPIGMVVDRLGSVRGVRGLRVIDASILPDVPSAATNPTVITVAEHIAESRVEGEIDLVRRR
ncbi:GMC oxidoreductase [Nonomuraea sp. NPDC050153]|uniref:GMC oxidoreductase n=1 Tax=Nonomuraea sp. NPDC050153 TaxID=3364359 RepID=UPI0037AFBE62